MSLAISDWEIASSALLKRVSGIDSTKVIRQTKNGMGLGDRVVQQPAVSTPARFEALKDLLPEVGIRG